MLEATRRFARLDDKEMKTREMTERFWGRTVRDMNESDVRTLSELRSHFDDQSPRGMTLGEQLKRINMLLMLARMEGHADLQSHFREYLAIFVANHLDHMVLTGGVNIVDMTAQWRHFSEADRMMEQWLEAAVEVCSPAKILSFAQAQGRRNRDWIAARLLEESLKSQDWGEARPAGQVVMCVALYEMYKALARPDSMKSEQAGAQVAWVDTGWGINSVSEALQQSLNEAKQAVENAGELGRGQGVMKSQLDAIERAISGAKGPSIY
jgi:hypothetical protein